jgi:xanthine dehydrogenase accessory factor
MKGSPPQNDWGLSGTAVIERMADVITSDQQAAVATVVNVEGSAYRGPGAKMLITADGRTGSVTAGCLESEVYDIAESVRETGQPQFVQFDLMDDENWGLGIGCNGIIDMYIEPLDKRYAELIKAHQERKNKTVLTIIKSTAGDIPSGKKLYMSDNKLDNTGNLPQWFVQKIEQRVKKSHNEKASNIKIKSGPNGASVHVFYNDITPPPKMYIFGGGSDIHPVTKLAKQSGFRVSVVPFREGQANSAKFPYAGEVTAMSAPDFTDSLSFDERSYAIVMSHNLIDDQIAVESLLQTPVPYIGIMGPTERFNSIRESIDQEGMLSDSELNRIYAPVGIDIGGGEPYQIALSIVSEVLAVHNSREPKHLRSREGSIH